MINRRELLSVIAGWVDSAGLIKAVEISHANIISVSNIMMLRKITAPEDRLCVVVLGYHFAGDGGAKLVYWDSASQKPANQGTVISAFWVIKDAGYNYMMGSLIFGSSVF